MENKPLELFTIADAAKRTGPRSFTTMVKPGGSACNLACTYCYYLEKARLYGGIEPLMSPDLLETYIRQFIEACESDTVEFCWHGGEPLMWGIDYFKRAMKLQRKYAAGKQIRNSLQTNGTLINEAWCAFLAENEFLVGLSLDGPRDIHNAHRLNRGGRPTFDKVYASSQLMRRMRVEFNTLSVVNNLCEARGSEIYRFLRDDVGSRFMQFLPAVDWINSETQKDSAQTSNTVSDIEDFQRRLAPWSVSSQGYGRFLCDIFDEWVRRDVGRTFVQIFDVTLSQWCGLPSGICTMAQTCGEGLAVEHNGDVYPCDHFVLPEYKLGNICETPLSELFDSEKRLRFSLFKRNALPAECSNCKCYHLCHGGCPGHRLPNGKNALCEGLKLFFAHCGPAMDKMKALLLADRAPAEIMYQL